MVRPVVEKMAAIVRRYLAGTDVDAIYLCGGTCCLTGIEGGPPVIGGGAAAGALLGAVAALGQLLHDAGQDQLDQFLMIHG